MFMLAAAAKVGLRSATFSANKWWWGWSDNILARRSPLEKINDAIVHGGRGFVVVVKLLVNEQHVMQEAGRLLSKTVVVLNLLL